ncbi:hypothetical protein FTUN_3662 [Frigoriglobus tundricola]|uniref:Uncharacterized protein n=1 Tax=Frigoriglobus tundricola TaxID=2774151 RepID=A0A6M5YQC4_9BACT|nr:hypothetical protein FTUN_3662 [Frigoriglobus tundricola]
MLIPKIPRAIAVLPQQLGATSQVLVYSDSPLAFRFQIGPQLKVGKVQWCR